MYAKLVSPGAKSSEIAVGPCYDGLFPWSWRGICYDYGWYPYDAKCSDGNIPAM